MLSIDKTEVYGWEAAIRGMRNPMNSWNRSDSEFIDVFEDVEDLRNYYTTGPEIGPKDLELMLNLSEAGSDHGKFRRFIIVSCDIVGPLYWWKEFDTYKVGTVANSCSTMHRIHAKEFTEDDFSIEHLEELPMSQVRGFNFKYDFYNTLETLNIARNLYIETKDKRYWWQMIQLLPSSYNQRRTVQMNYEVLANIYKSRKNHKLDEWHIFCTWIKTLPYSEIITGEE